MKRLLLLALALMITIPTMAQKAKFGGSYYDCRMAAHQEEPIPHGAIIWIGDSLTEQGWWSFLSKEKNIVNRGIGGDNTYGMLHRLPLYLDAEPSKIFFMGGVNDISANYAVEDIFANIVAMVDMIKQRVPQCELYIQSVITPNNDVLAYDYIKNKQSQMAELNDKLEQMCREKQVIWVDLRPVMHNEQGELRKELTKDGIHIHPEAYMLWVKHLKEKRYIRK